jgi:IS605 OrfB family transposase
MSKEYRAIKFYLDESVNNIKKDKILTFLKECQDAENKLLEHYWKDENFKIILKSTSKIDMNYNTNIGFKDITPRLKSHHFYTILNQVYEQLKSLQSNIINKIYFRFDDKDKQRIYNYMSKFCFEWERMEKHINKKLKEHKKSNDNYYKFLLNIEKLIKNTEEYRLFKTEIEVKFFSVKESYKLPIKKVFQIRCDTYLTATVDKSNYYQWIFTIDNNTIIGGCDYRPKFDTIIIPVKYSDYHNIILECKELKNTFNLKLNKYGRVEIIGFYEVNIDKIEPNPTNKVGIDIGLKKLIVCSDGEIVEQNTKLIKMAEKLIKHKSNRDNLQKHLKKKYQDENYILGNKNYLRKEARLTQSVIVDNRYKIKQFLKGRENDLIVMEDLDIGYSKTYSRMVNYLLRRMHIQGIKNDMIKYCKQFGIGIALINPAFTSQQCSCCGYVSKENRKTQEKFLCVKCGFETNADFNASVNIKNRFGDKRIKLDTPYWKIKEILSFT